MRKFDPVPWLARFVRVGAWGTAILVPATLLYLYFFAKPITPRNSEWESPPRIWICDSAPDWVHGEIDDAIAIWDALGYQVEGVHTGPCGGYYVGEISIHHHPGQTNHAGLCYRPDGEGTINWGIIQVASHLAAPSGANRHKYGRLPKNPYLNLLAHELGHCLGFGHTYTKVGPFVAYPSGHLMNPHLWKTGLDVSAIPRGNHE